MRIASQRRSPARTGVLLERRPIGALPALAGALALALAGAPALAGCAGGRRASHGDGSPVDHREAGEAGRDAGPHALPGAAARPAEPTEPTTKPAATPGASAAAAGTGAVEVSVTWDDAPARLRSSPGRNACGASRPAPVQVHTLGGVAGAVVFVRRRADSQAPAGAPDEQPAQPALLALRQCRGWPRVVLLARPGDVVALVNDDERRHEVSIERMAAGPVIESENDAGSGPAVSATIALPVVGSRAELRWPAAGIYRVAAADADAAFVIVPDDARAGVTTILGSVRFDDVPIGSYDVLAWHPPVDATGAPISKQALVTVAAGHTSQSTVPLTWP
jgi:hypothetical protein